MLFLFFLAPAALVMWAVGDPLVSLIGGALVLVASWACKAEQTSDGQAPFRPAPAPNLHRPKAA